MSRVIGHSIGKGRLSCSLAHSLFEDWCLAIADIHCFVETVVLNVSTLSLPFTAPLLPFTLFYLSLLTPLFTIASGPASVFVAHKLLAQKSSVDVLSSVLNISPPMTKNEEV